MRRHYSNVSPPVALVVTATAGATVLQVASTAGYPDTPFILAAERGTDNEEVMLCTDKDASTFTVTRGFDGTTARQHQAGMPVEHVTAAVDFDEPNEHVNDAVLHQPFSSGMVMPFAGSAAPTGWLFAQGQTVAQDDYPDLFSVVGTAYNTGGEGAGNFRLPDLRGRVPVGRNAADTSFDTLGETGGAKTVTLTTGQMPAHDHDQAPHSHGVNDPEHEHGYADPQHTHGGVGVPAGENRFVVTYAGSSIRMDTSVGQEITYTAIAPAATGIDPWHASTGISIQNFDPVISPNGGGGAHENMPPYLVLNYIIKT